MAEKKSISKNIIYSIIIQITGFVAPLITSPYIARVLSAEIIGDYGYTFANSTYFALAECLGLALYGTLRVTQVRDDEGKLSRLFYEIMILKIILMLISTTAYVVLFLVFGNEYRTLYMILILNLISSGIDVTWFLCGVEEFKIAAIRSIVVRVLNVLLILFFVNSVEDIYIYALIMQGCTLLGNIIMYPTVFNYVGKVKGVKLKIFRHVIPSLVYFVPGLINTIFSSADKTILGMFSSSQEVGLYEQANKICQLCMGMISAVSSAVLPRVAYISSKYDSKDELEKMLSKSVVIALFFAMPICAGVSALSDNFIPFFFGIGYDKSALLLKILCFNVLFVSLSNFMGQQCLVARGKQKEYNICISVSAFLNIVLNLIMVKSLKSIGVSIASVISALIGLIMVVIYTRSIIDIKRLIQICRNYVIAAIVMYCSICNIAMQSYGISVSIQIGVGVFVYIGVLVISRDKMIYSIVDGVRKR